MDSVHLVLWAQQPDLLVVCDRSWTTPDWAQPALPEGVHRAEDGRLYTFDECLATCAACTATAADPVKRAAAASP